MNDVPFRHKAAETGHSSVALSQYKRFSGRDPNTGTSEYEITARSFPPLFWFTYVLIYTCFKLTVLLLTA